MLSSFSKTKFTFPLFLLLFTPVSTTLITLLLDIFFDKQIYFSSTFLAVMSMGTFPH